MRKFVISIAAAGTALAFATPAAAQYYPQPQVYPQQPYGYNNFAPNNYGQLRALQARIDLVQRQIDRLDRRDRVRDRSSDRLRDESRNIERRLHRAARNGLNNREAYDIQNRIARLEQRVNYALASGYGRYGQYGNGGYVYADRDRDGRDDRYEDDRGYNHDR